MSNPLQDAYDAGEPVDDGEEPTEPKTGLAAAYDIGDPVDEPINQASTTRQPVGPSLAGFQITEPSGGAGGLLDYRVDIPRWARGATVLNPALGPSTLLSAVTEGPQAAVNRLAGGVGDIYTAATGLGEAAHSLVEGGRAPSDILQSTYNELSQPAEQINPAASAETFANRATFGQVIPRVNAATQGTSVEQARARLSQIAQEPGAAYFGGVGDIAGGQVLGALARPITGAAANAARPFMNTLPTESVGYRLLPHVGRAAAQGIEGATAGALQAEGMGGDVSDIRTSALLGAGGSVLPAAAVGASRFAESLNRPYRTSRLQSLGFPGSNFANAAEESRLVSEADRLRVPHNPEGSYLHGQGVQREAGTEIESVLGESGNPSVSTQPILADLDRLRRRAAETVSGQQLANTISRRMEGLQDLHPNGQITLADIQRERQDIDKLINWRADDMKPLAQYRKDLRNVFSSALINNVGDVAPELQQRLLQANQNYSSAADFIDQAENIGRTEGRGGSLRDIGTQVRNVGIGTLAGAPFGSHGIGLGTAIAAGAEAYRSSPGVRAYAIRGTRQAAREAAALLAAHGTAAIGGAHAGAERGNATSQYVNTVSNLLMVPGSFGRFHDELERAKNEGNLQTRLHDLSSNQEFRQALEALQERQ